MSSLKLENIVNAKNYKKIRTLKISQKQRFQLKNYAVKQKILSIASLLDEIPNYTVHRYRVKKSHIVKKFTRFYQDYMKGDYTAIGNATKVISFYLYSLIPNKNLIGTDLNNFRGQTFSKITEKDINEKVLKRFEKIRQWPHLTLMLFPKHNSGSCHDYTLLRAMLLESQNLNYRLEVYTGTNTLLSHVDLRKVRSPVKTRVRIINFLLLTLFHTFRTHQTLKYITKSSQKMRALENTIYSILYTCTENSTLASNLFQHLLTRRHNSYAKILK